MIIDVLGRFWKISLDNLGMAPKGIESINISASFYINSISRDSAPISSANFWTVDFPLELAMATLYPALANFLAIVPPIAPVPITLTFIFVYNIN